MLNWMVITLGFVVTFTSAADKEVSLSGVDGWKWVMAPSGFNTYYYNSSWTITTDPGSTIKVYCPFVRFPNGGIYGDGTCKNGRMVFNDGVSKTIDCPNSQAMLYEGKSSKLKMDYTIAPSYVATFYCEAKSVKPPQSYETIDISPGKSLRIQFPEENKSGDKAWRFKSTSKKEISLECTTKLQRSATSGCSKDILTINAGKGDREFCGKEKATAKGSEITMRVESYERGTVDCVVKG